MGESDIRFHKISFSNACKILFFSLVAQIFQSNSSAMARKTLSFPKGFMKKLRYIHRKQAC